MFVSTIVEMDGDSSPISFTSETNKFKFLNAYNHFLFSSGVYEENNLDYLDLRSSTNKVFISSNVGPFHILYENIFPIMNISKTNTNIEIIIDIFEIDARNNNNFIDYIEKLQSENIKITFINSSGYGGIILNNYYLFNAYNKDMQAMSRKTIEENVQKLTVYPNTVDKKVYVSREKFLETSPIRISNEKDLEHFFIENGFEIVYPEDFISIADEITFFSKVKLLVSLSSSAISWATFMKPGGTVIELQTDFADMPGHRAIHHQYGAICYAKDHTYITIPNYDRLSDKLIKRIKDSNVLNIVK